MPNIEAIRAVERAEERLIEQHVRDPALAKALGYKVRGEELIQPSYKAYLMFVIEMSQRGEPMEIVKSGAPELVKPDEGDRKTWFWNSHKIIRNKKTGHESEGIGVMAFEGGDEFTTRKALSFADRNAIRGQIPELPLRSWLTKAIEEGKGELQDVEPIPADVVAPEDREAVEAARKQMGVPPGGTKKSLSAAPSGGGGSSSPPASTGGAAGDWGTAGDGGSMPTKSQMQFLTSANRLPADQMTVEQVKTMTRREANDVIDRIQGEQK